MPVHALDDALPSLPPEGRYWIAPDAQLVGAVTLSHDCGVWFGAMLRADNAPITLGARCNVQEHAVLHVDEGFPVVVGEGVTIGHRAIAHGCIVGSNTLIGMGATILTGARIGADSIVGAGALVTEGKSFPDGSLLVGSPARLSRALRPDEIARNRASADAYVANWRRFARGLRAVAIRGPGSSVRRA